MRHGSLESGLGGFDLAAEWMGWENIFHCEINPFCRTILNYYWPNAKSYADIFEFDGLPWRGKVDIITAGFPCQPFSHAGKRKGTDDDRHIWPENLRVIKEIQPPFVIAENVPGLLTIERGLVFETVCADLEDEGYEVTPFIIPACATGAIHRRDRIWIVAYSGSFRSTLSIQQRGQRSTGHINADSEIADVANDPGYNERDTWLPGRSIKTEQVQVGRCDSNSTTSNLPTAREFANMSKSEFNAAYTFNTGLQRNEQRQSFEQGAGPSRPITERLKNEIWIEAATRLCSVDDESAGGLDTETFFETAGIKKPKRKSSKTVWREESLKAYGNAIYWPVAYEIFKAIEKIA